MGIKVHPLAADSMGTRSMATFVDGGREKVLIDPGVALGPRRYGLPPHPREYERLQEHWKVIEDHLSKADVIVITHYHYDHYAPESPELYKDKILLLKHPKANINRSQRRRAAHFLGRLEGMVEELHYCDGIEYSYGSVDINFSEPVCHGTNNRLGYVVEVSVSKGDAGFFFTSDVEGPSLDEQVNFIIEEDPKVILADGPMTYMLGYRYSRGSLELSIKNLCRIVEKTGVENLILDHHLLRDLEWRKRMEPLFENTEDVCISSAAEYGGMENQLLEAGRKELYQLE